MLDSRLQDASRVAALIPPFSIQGVTLTTRMFNSRNFTIEDYVRMETLDSTL